MHHTYVIYFLIILNLFFFFEIDSYYVPSTTNRLTMSINKKKHTNINRQNYDNTKLTSLKETEKNLLKELNSVKEAKKNLIKQNPLHIGVIGYGKFGKYLTEIFLNQGHNVSVLSRTNYSNMSCDKCIDIFYGLDIDDDKLNDSPWPLSQEKNSYNNFFHKDFDIIVLSISILSFEKVVKKIYNKLLDKDILIVDVLSVKTHPKFVLTKFLPPDCDILCTHPMFGPESAPVSRKNMKFMYDYISERSSDKERIEKFLSIFDEEGCQMIQMDSSDHDLKSANSQFATHLIGRILQQLQLNSTSIDTKSFEKILEIKSIVSDDSFDLFYGLYKYNPNSMKTLLLLQKALIEIEFKLNYMESLDLGIEGWKLDQDKFNL